MARICKYLIVYMITTLMLFSIIPGQSTFGTGPSSRSPEEGGWSMNFTVASEGVGTDSPSIVMAGGVLHCAFVNDAVHYTRSLDNGAHWEPVIVVSDTGTQGALTPGLAAEGSDVYLIWNQETGNVNTHKLWFSKSNDSGRSFTDAEVLSGNNNHWSTDGRIEVLDGNLYVAWAYDTSFSNQEVFFKRSTDKGETWGPDVQMTSANWPSFHVGVGVSGNKVHLLWEDERDPFGGSHKIFYKRSDDGGSTWTTDYRITQLGIDVIEPSLAVEGDTLHAVWSRQPYNIEYVRSDNGGLTWGNIQTIASGNSIHRHEPFIQVEGDFVQVVWNENGNLTYKNSTNGGLSWGNDIQLALETPIVFYQWGYQPLEVDSNGSYLAYSWDDREIRFRYKGKLSDLSIGPSDIEVSEWYGTDGKTYINITTTVHNIGLRDTLDATLELYLDSQQPNDKFEESSLGPISIGESATRTVLWSPTKTDNMIYFVVNDTNPYESDLGNNRASKEIMISNFYPTSVIQADSLAAKTFEDLTFDGTGSSDPDGTIQEYFFEFGDGNDSGWITASSTKHYYEDDGCYTVSLKVKDDKDGESGWATLNVDIFNRNPTADLQVTTSEVARFSLTTINFTAEASSDMDGTIVNYTWDLGDGISGTGPTASRSYDEPGTKTVRVRVRDDDNTTADASVTFEIGNLVPIADARTSDDVTTIDKGDSVDFDATGSYDPDGDIETLIWDFGDGSTKQGWTVSKTFRKPGTYNVSLTVTDTLGAQATDNLTIIVINQLPTVLIEGNETTVRTYETISFTSKADDEDGTITSYFWDFGDGNTSRSPNTEHQYADDGEYTVTVTVTDDNDEAGNASLMVKVMNRKPVAMVDANNTLVYVNDQVSFTAEGSFDRDGAIVEYSWEFSDGDTGSGVEVVHSFSKARTYVVTLLMTDDDGALANAEITIEVVEKEVDPPPKPPNGDDDQDQARIMMMVGGLAAIIIIIIIVVVVILLLKRRRPLPSEQYEEEDLAGGEPYDDAEPYHDHSEEGHGPGDVDGDGPEEEYDKEETD